MAMSSSTSTSTGALHCTLFLFDDKLMIVKRPHASASGRTLTGLDQLARAAKAGGLPLGVKKNGMSFKGVVDVTDVVATDVGMSGGSAWLQRCVTCSRFMAQTSISISRRHHRTKLIDGPHGHSVLCPLYIHPHPLTMIPSGRRPTSNVFWKTFGQCRPCTAPNKAGPSFYVHRNEK